MKKKTQKKRYDRGFPLSPMEGRNNRFSLGSIKNKDNQFLLEPIDDAKEPFFLDQVEGSTWFLSEPYSPENREREEKRERKREIKQEQERQKKIERERERERKERREKKIQKTRRRQEKTEIHITLEQYLEIKIYYEKMVKEEKEFEEKKEMEIFRREQDNIKYYKPKPSRCCFCWRFLFTNELSEPIDNFAREAAESARKAKEKNDKELPKMREKFWNERNKMAEKNYKKLVEFIYKFIDENEFPEFYVRGRRVKFEKNHEVSLILFKLGYSLIEECISDNEKTISDDEKSSSTSTDHTNQLYGVFYYEKLLAYQKKIISQPQTPGTKFSYF